MLFLFHCMSDYVNHNQHTLFDFQDLSFEIFEVHCWPQIKGACKWNDKETSSVESLWLFLEIVHQYPLILKNKAIMLEVSGRKKLVTDEFAKEASSVILVKN